LPRIRRLVSVGITGCFAPEYAILNVGPERGSAVSLEQRAEDSALQPAPLHVAVGHRVEPVVLVLAHPGLPLLVHLDARPHGLVV
jgi:hypothetical protein